MAKPRPEPNQHNGEPLFGAIDGSGGDGAAAGADALADLREMLASAGAPEDLLRMLEGPGTPDELLERVVGSGLLPSAEDSLAGLIEFFEPLLEPDTEPLEAELAGSEFLGMLREGADAEDDVPEMLRMLVGQVEEHGGPAALAMLRVLAVMAPARVRVEAGEAADRLAAAGLVDPPWTIDLGAPKLGPCFGYADVFGAQETIAIAFRYRRKRHALCVLIDHELGGGVKDCWATDQVTAVRAEFGAAADPELMEFREYEPAEAHEILSTALGKQPCPEQPDQIRDVRSYLELLRRRVAWLAAAAAIPEQRGKPEGTPRVHRLKVGLKGAKPPIWRRLEVPSRCTLATLHDIIQRAFDWEDCHLWSFETAHGEYGTGGAELGQHSARSARLNQVAQAEGDRIQYTYDYGDNWRHEIQVEHVAAAEAGVAYPRCIGGRRAAPPEDCGGVWGYQDLLEVLADPAHPEHAHRLDWLGLSSADEHDPAAFRPDEVNELLPAEVLVKS